MRNPTFRLTFSLPAVLGLVPYGRHQPCLAGCVLTVERCGLVTIEGPSRDALFDQLRRWLRVNARGMALPPFPVIVRTPPQICVGGPDTWWVTVGAEIAFSPSGLPPHVPAALATGV